MRKNVETARKLGYLDIPRGTLVDIDKIKGVAADKQVIITTGAQGQPAMPSLKMRGDVRMQHDVAAGFLRKIEGTIATEQRIPMPGMPTGEIDSDTMLEMVRVK